MKYILELFLLALKDDLFKKLIQQKSFNNGRMNKQATNKMINSHIYGKTGYYGFHNFVGVKTILERDYIIITLENHDIDETSQIVEQCFG